MTNILDWFSIVAAVIYSIMTILSKKRRLDIFKPLSYTIVVSYVILETFTFTALYLSKDTSGKTCKLNVYVGAKSQDCNDLIVPYISGIVLFAAISSLDIKTRTQKRNNSSSGRRNNSGSGRRNNSSSGRKTIVMEEKEKIAAGEKEKIGVAKE
nr:8321_t:CDS:2 [Entrophospora candida]